MGFNRFELSISRVCCFGVRLRIFVEIFFCKGIEVEGRSYGFDFYCGFTRCVVRILSFFDLGEVLFFGTCSGIFFGKVVILRFWVRGIF